MSKRKSIPPDELINHIDLFESVINLIENDELVVMRFCDLIVLIPELRDVTLNILKQKLVELNKRLEEEK